MNERIYTLTQLSEAAKVYIDSWLMYAPVTHTFLKSFDNDFSFGFNSMESWSRTNSPFSNIPIPNFIMKISKPIAASEVQCSEESFPRPNRQRSTTHPKRTVSYQNDLTQVSLIRICINGSEKYMLNQLKTVNSKKIFEIIFC